MLLKGGLAALLKRRARVIGKPPHHTRRVKISILSGVFNPSAPLLGERHHFQGGGGSHETVGSGGGSWKSALFQGEGSRFVKL